ncbi:MAG: hypothetical protein ACREBG_07800 [Pyrinomonadaceae bacterium]
MRSTALAATLFGILLTSAFTQVNQTTSLQPTRFEAFANRPTARIKWSSQVWRAESAEARVIVTTLVVEDTTHSPQQMSGIRIDLTKENASDQIYLDEAKLETTRKALTEISRGIPRFRRERSGTGYRHLGAEEFWHPYPTIHTLNASYYIAPDSSGLFLSAYKNEGFRFPGRSPSELAAAIARAMDELKRR